ncbi:MAG TPA: 30S ribosomal protein S2, partial [Ghiorsea sp.]|nr:30S ribosomal protein S2 [Ghiorsea sp.]
MAQFTMKQLLEAGVHFGHQTRRWNPKMAPYIFGSRNGIHIIDLQKTLRMANESYDFMRELAAAGGRVLFVGTKRQATDAVKEESTRAGQYFVNHRWLGGMLTNFQTVQQSVRKMKDLQRKKEEGIFDLITKKEGLKLQSDLEKLERTLGGVQEMTHLPDCLFIVDVQKEDLAVKEAQKLGIPVVAIVDSNCNPTGIDYVVPGNDDAIRAVRLFCSKMADAILEGAETFQLENAEEGEDIVEAMVNQAEAAEEVAEVAEAKAEEAKAEEAKAEEAKAEEAKA